jgi:hypothetical protein
MMNRFSLLLLCVPALGLFAACSSATSSSSITVAGADGGADGESTTDASTGGGTSCSKARDDLLVPINKVSTGTVSVVSESGGTKTLYIDASGGGTNNAIKNPRVYVDLEAGAKVELTDTTAPASTAWDLALKRDKIFTNSGDAGAGMGGAMQVLKSFASVSASEAEATNLEKEKFFDADCNPQLDQTMTVSTTFSDWYDYDQVTHIPSPKDVTYVVQGGTGKKYKVAITSYSGLADGGTGMATAFYILKVSAL